AVTALIDAGAQVNMSDFSGFTPLMAAALWDDSSIAELLLEDGADVNSQSNDGDTAL
ncbi:hypothetical protein PHYSODRAFT_434609, partial [Phytophthora sojae]